MRHSWTISRYLIGAVLPYFVFSWLLLSVILFVQQAGRFSDIFFSVNIPTSLIWQLTIALVPNVIAFTCPMAALVGVIIGLTKMQGDSEITAIRAAGVGNFEITLPIAAIGVLLSLFAFFVNLFGVPLAARIVRQVAMQAAIYKLESPIEPGVFNTEVAGFTIYVKEGDLENGRWKNIFIYNADDKTSTVRLITSSNGRIDSTDEQSELVLEDAVSTTFSETGAGGETLVSEKIGEIRYAVKTRRGELIEKLGGAELSPEELGLAQLSEYAGRKDGRERIEAQILQLRRLILSISPLIFCLLGTALVLRFSRRGRGFGIFVALISLISYYLLAFLGEQLARTEKISVAAGGIIPLAGSLLAILWFNLAGRIRFRMGWTDSIRTAAANFSPPRLKLQRRNLFMDLTTGLRDLDILFNIAKFYLLTLGFLAAVFIIFTAFELWKFAGTMDGGIVLLIKYLTFLLPFIYLQLAPSAAMIATLATFVIKSRQNEIVTWTSAGQSVYRLLLPCMVFMLGLGLLNFGVQEAVSPLTNRTQDEVRNRLRSRGVLASSTGKYWVADDRRIYSFEMPSPASDNVNGTGVDGSEKAAGDSGVEGQASAGREANIDSAAASDNEKEAAPGCSGPDVVRGLTIYEFGDKGTELQSVYRISCARWRSDRIEFTGRSTRTMVASAGRETIDVTGQAVEESLDPFTAVRTKPSHLRIGDIKEQISQSESELEKRNFGVALEKRYSTLFLPFIIALFTAPFALSLSRKGKAVTVGNAVGLWLVFMGVNSTFEQFGLNGYLSPGFAVWSPLILFTMLGVYLMSKIKT